MDLTLRGKAWVGNIYQRFEAICQEVDDFVTKDSVKYVESQVQTVGESVKKFYSDVVQDLLTLSGDPAKQATEADPAKQFDLVEIDAESVLDADKKPNDIGYTELSVQDKGNIGTDAEVSLTTLINGFGGKSSHEGSLDFSRVSGSDLDVGVEAFVDSDMGIGKMSRRLRNRYINIFVRLDRPTCQKHQ